MSSAMAAIPTFLAFTLGMYRGNKTRCFNLSNPALTPCSPSSLRRCVPQMSREGVISFVLSEDF